MCVSAKLLTAVSPDTTALGLSTVDKNDMKDAETVRNRLKVYAYISPHYNVLYVWRQVLDTNVLSIIAMCRSIVPGMKQRGEGHVINIGACERDANSYTDRDIPLLPSLLVSFPPIACAASPRQIYYALLPLPRLMYTCLSSLPV